MTGSGPLAMKVAGSALDFDTPLDRLAPGVYGYTVEENGALYIPVIEAQFPGQGDVARYFDSLPADKTIRVPCVISPILEDMLKRRGYTVVEEWSALWGEHVDVYERAAIGEG